MPSNLLGSLLWQKRYRALTPVSARSVGADGRAILIRPDEFENRTYRILAVDPGGTVAEVGLLSVETVRKFETSPDGRLQIGMTNDDLYLFREGRKTRLLPDRRVTFADASLAPEPGAVLCGLADSLFASHTVVLADLAGRIAWTLDLRQPVARVALSGDGQSLAVALQGGRLLMLDNLRRTLWECSLPEPVVALAMPTSGPLPIAGTESGHVFALDAEGGVLWQSPIGLPVIAVATDRERQWVAVVASDGTTHLLVCLGPDGAPVWEQPLEARPTGVALSPDGRYLALSSATGHAWGYRIDLEAAHSAQIGARRARDLQAARAALEEGQPEAARATLAALVETAPHDLEAADLLIEATRRCIERLREQARELAAQERLPESAAALEAAFALDPWNPELFAEAREARKQALEALAHQAAQREAERDWDAAEALWRAVLALDPTSRQAREALNRIRVEQAAEWIARGDASREAGDLAGALAAWNEARRLRPGEELDARVRQAEAERCVAAGVALYEAHRLPEAIFQLKKALALDPGNEQALRYLRYAEAVAGDTQIADRFTRLE